MALKSIIKKHLPAPLAQFSGSVSSSLRSTRTNIDRVLSTSTPRLSSFYYFLLNKAFDREHFGVAAGKARFAHDLTVPGKSSFRLRRNIHRLEKGLIMPNRRSVFGMDYIRPTVDDFIRVVAGYDDDRVATAELVWAHDVLADYFDAVDLSVPRLEECYRKFLTAQATYSQYARATPTRRSVPFQRDLTVEPATIDQLTDLSIRRRSVRAFTNRPVDRYLVDRAVAVAAQSPSACNRQPFRFRLYDDRDLVRKIIELPAGTKGFSGTVPSVAVIVGRLRAYPLERDRHIIYIDGSLAAMSFMFALESMGIASCAINWADEEPAESRIKAMLNLEDDERVVMLIAYGWPDPQALVPYSAKRELDDMREFNVL